MSRAHGRPLKNFKVLFIFFIYILKSLVVLAKTMPIANVNRIVFVNYHSVSQFDTNRQPIAVWYIYFHSTFIQILTISIGPGDRQFA